MEGTNERRGWRSWGGKAALAAGGVLVGGVLVGTLTASAANDNTANQGAFGMAYPGQGGAYGAPGQGGGPGRHGGPRGDADESRSQRPDEELLTGDTAAKSGRPPWPGTRARPSCGSRPTPTASTRPT